MSSIEIKNEELVALLGKDGPFPLEFAQQEFRPIYSVNHVHITIISLLETRYALITACGEVPTTGWTQPHLQPYIYIQPPPDGIWDFVFVARPPSGIVLEVIFPIATTYLFRMGAFPLRGVRVHSTTNTITQMVGKEASAGN